MLAKECADLGRCPTGESVITDGYRLPATHVLHSVGPTREDHVALRSCYQTALDLAEKAGLRTLGLCCISTPSTETFGFPFRKATHTALETVRTWLDAHPNALDRVIF